MAESVDVVDVEEVEGELPNKLETTDVHKAKAFFLLDVEAKKCGKDNKSLEFGWLLYKDNIMTGIHISKEVLKWIFKTNIPIINVIEKPFLPSGDLILAN